MTTSDPIALAGSIADAIVASAISDGDRATWLAPVIEVDGDRRHVTLQTGDPTLYQGSAGIAWACAEAGAVLGRDDLARLGVAGARASVARAGDDLGSGLYDGSTGVGLVALTVGLRAGDADLAEAGRALLGRAARSPASGPDLIHGGAGVLAGLLAADRIDGGRGWLRAAGRIGAALLEDAERRDWGWGWPLPGMDEPALCGLAHGTSGIAWALGELEAASDPTTGGRGGREVGADGGAVGIPDGVANGIAGALRFERSWFDHRTNTWPDLRAGLTPAGEPPPRPTIWCHGAPGIGLARLRLNALRPDPTLVAEAAAALQSSVSAAEGDGDAAGLAFGLTVCHGVGGTLELLVSAAEALDEVEHLEAAGWLLDRAVDRLGPDVERWPSGVDGSPSVPGLMTGLAGTMLVLLRLAHPGRLMGVGLPFVDWAAGERRAARADASREAVDIVPA
jgi:lantibiotic biosynthesis protein